MTSTWPLRLDEGRERVDRLPDRHVDDHAIVLVGAQGGGVALLGLQAPDEARRGVGHGVDRVEQRHELGHDRPAGAADVELGDVEGGHSYPAMSAWARTWSACRRTSSSPPMALRSPNPSARSAPM